VPGARSPSSPQTMGVAEPLRRVPVNQRPVLLLRDVLDLPIEEVAEQLGLPVSTVRGRFARARANLARHLAAGSFEARVTLPTTPVINKLPGCGRNARPRPRPTSSPSTSRSLSTSLRACAELGQRVSCFPSRPVQAGTERETGGMTRGDLTDNEWTVFEPLLPLGERGGPMPDLRRLVNGVMWRFRTGGSTCGPGPGSCRC
jgi:hypothetical protein